MPLQWAIDEIAVPVNEVADSPASRIDSRNVFWFMSAIRNARVSAFLLALRYVIGVSQTFVPWGWKAAPARAAASCVLKYQMGTLLEFGYIIGLPLAARVAHWV